MGADRDARGGRRGKDNGRDAGGFLALPWSVLDSAAYLGLSYPARALLLEVARQFNHDNNGKMLLSERHLAQRGWKGSGVITRAKRELLDAGLIYQTVLGMRPNKASWYAVTWRKLDKIDGFDAGAAQAFERGAYLKLTPPTPGESVVRKNAPLTLSPGVERHLIAPGESVESTARPPGASAIRGVFTPPPTPGARDPLDLHHLPTQEAPGSGVRVGVPAVSEAAGGGAIFSRSLLGQLQDRKAKAAPATPPGWTATGETTNYIGKRGPVMLQVLTRPCRTCGKPFKVSAPVGAVANKGTLCYVNCPDHRMTHAEVSRLGNIVANKNRKGTHRKTKRLSS